MGTANWTPEFFIENERQCLNHLQDKEVWKKIPLLNQTKLHEIQDNSFVRFRGVVQDMLNPECYLSDYVVDTRKRQRGQNGKYRDTLYLHDNESLDKNLETQTYSSRRPIFLISVPGLNEWAEKLESHSGKITKLSENITSSELEINNTNKRSMEIDENEEKMETNSTLKKFNNGENNIENKPNKLISSCKTTLACSPIPSRPSKMCIVKLYSDFDEYILNSVIDVVGFLSINSALTQSELQEESDNDEDDDEYNPPPSLVPRLHAVLVKKLEHFNPLLEQTLNSITVEEDDLCNQTEIQKNINLILTQCLFGDSIAAEYLFCHLVSTVYIRNDVMPLGKFTLNITNIPNEVLPDYTKLLYGIIELLLPASVYFPMTLENLNDSQFFPKPDPKTDKLESGILQLAPKTHLIIDETELQPGKLETSGINALQNISHVIITQQIKCIFKFFEMNYDVDIPILILSEGKSMLPSDYLCPLKPETISHYKENIEAATFFLQSKANSIRKFLTKMKIQKFDMNPVDPEMIQNDFVKMRREKNATASDLHSLLVLSRLISLTKGETLITKESWERAKFIEDERKSRIKI